MIFPCQGKPPPTSSSSILFPSVMMIYASVRGFPISYDHIARPTYPPGVVLHPFNFAKSKWAIWDIKLLLM